MLRAFFSTLVIIIFSASAQAQTISDFTKEMERKQGFFDIYLDHQKGAVYLEIKKFDQDFIYKVSLPGALGSNDVALDRGQLGDTKLVYFGRVGEKVLLHQKNTRYIATSDNPSERLAAVNAFAPSIVWSFKAVATDKDGSTLINITDMMMSDQHGIADKIKRSGQGDFSFNEPRSFVNFDKVKTFPKNTELESSVTFMGNNPGNFVRSVAANPKIITLKQRISFVELPDDNYQPRIFDPAMSFNDTEVVDYGTPIDQPIVKRYINRHRLVKKDPNAAISEPVNPIIYYIDRGAPPLIREALREGVEWWNEAFEAAGFKNAFQAKIMPEDMDPDDVRYNVVNWVHRSTRGWSYGASVRDPRTGEIIKGHVTLGSLRSRQDFMIANAVTGPYKDGKADIDDSIALVIARTRQLGAHEVGHTLGFAHNYIASTNDDDDVMDYPHPKMSVDKDGNISIKNPYREKIGEWNKIAVNWGYRQYANEGEEKAGLQKILKDAYASGHQFVADGPDSRGVSSLHADSHLWDFGDDVLQATKQMYEVRKVALAKFGLDNIADGIPLSSLEETLVPLYYLPRFQINAAAKSIGGMIYGYEVKGANLVPRHTMVSRERQDAAMDLVLEALSPDYLTLPKHILDLIPPKAFGYELTNESFPRDTGASFDALALVEAHANHTLGLLFDRYRLARVNDFNVRDSSQISLDRYIVKIAQNTILAARLDDPLKAAVQRRVGYVFVHYMMMTAADQDASPAVQAMVASHLAGLKGILEEKIAKEEMNREYKAHYQAQARRIGLFLEGKYMPKSSDLAQIPPGEPI
ncbi:MAG: zinc-dependent metalloprotease [Kordiimonadaceae bacterium]|nr:zinc-dependent metalloprotease [Kordiimonadaceae bacterium]